MKNYRMLVPVVLALIMGLSWYMLISEKVSVKNKYESYLDTARVYAKDGITKYAIENYNEALSIKDEPEVYVEVIEYFKSQGYHYNFMDWCEYFFETHEKEPKAYEYVLDAYLEDKDYSSVYSVLNAAERRSISTEKITKIRSDVKYLFNLAHNTYDDVSTFNANKCAVKNNDYWSYVNHEGTLITENVFKQVGDFTNSGMASVVDVDDNAYFVDAEGDKVKVSQEKYMSFGNISHNIIPAQKTNTQYVYLDMEFNQLYGEYDLATTFNDNVAAVKSNKIWTLINTEGKAINDKKYVDVISDDREVISICERMFVAEKENQYKMLNNKGKEVVSQVYEDVQLFMGEEPTAVKIDGKWCFIDLDGKRISEKTYDDARPYSNGLAAVCIDGKWGFVDVNENVVIEPQFFDAKAFNASGCCFVKTGSEWQLLKLYRFN